MRKIAIILTLFTGVVQAQTGFSVPVFVGPTANKIEVPSARLKYQLSNGLKLGESWSLNPGEIFMSQSAQGDLELNWPRNLVDEGSVELVNPTGQVIWSTQLSADKLNSFKEKNKKSQWRIDKDDIFKLLETGKHNLFGFCISKREQATTMSLCSTMHSFKAAKVTKVEVESKPQILIADRPAPQQDSFDIGNNPVAMAVVIADGSSVQFNSPALKLQYAHIAKSKDNSVCVNGNYGKPLKKFTLINAAEEGLLAPTLADKNEYWQVCLAQTEPGFYLEGPLGVPVYQSLPPFAVLPDDAKITLMDRSRTSTYSEKVPLKLMAGKDANPTSQEFGVEKDPKTGQLSWIFKADKKGRVNRSNIAFKDAANKSWLGQYEVYRGYPYDLSMRLTGIMTNENRSVILSELAANAWFESLFGWQNNGASLQRWGVGARYSRSLADLSSTGSSILAASNFALKYRFTPGIWNRDASSGVLLDFQQVAYGTVSATMLGGGLFWARSMPRLFDNLLNLIPIFRYPKWVDAQFVYYASSPSGATLASNYSVDFHSKVFWTKQFNGELGAGLRSYGYTSATLISITSFYGTFGVGYTF